MGFAHQHRHSKPFFSDSDVPSDSVEKLARRLAVPRITVCQQQRRCPDGSTFYSPQFRWHLLVKSVVVDFCQRFAKGGLVLGIADAENGFSHLNASRLTKLGVTLDSAAKIPDVIVHLPKKNWLFLIEAVTSAGPVDGKRRKELKELFSDCKAGLVFVTAFETRKTMRRFVSQIAWESEVWIAEDPDHMIHFNGQRFLGPYPDVAR